AVRSGERGRRFQKDHRLLRDVHPALRRVIAIVQPDAHDLARTRDRRPETSAGGNLRRLRRIARAPGAQPGAAAAGGEFLVEVGADRRHIDAAAIVELRARPFASGRAEANQLHETTTLLTASGSTMRNRQSQRVWPRT